MKKLIITIAGAATCLFSQSSLAHGFTQTDLQNLVEAYAFVYQQKQLIENARKQFPNDKHLMIEVSASEAVWNTDYPNSEEALLSHIDEFGLTREKLTGKLEAKLRKFNSNRRFHNKNEALKLVHQFTGVTDHPTQDEKRIFATVSDVTFSEYPAEELFVHKKTYSESLPREPNKSPRKFQISLPESWEKKPLDHPFSLGYWTKSDEHALITVLVLRERQTDDLPFFREYHYLMKRIKEDSAAIWKEYGPLEDESIAKGRIDADFVGDSATGTALLLDWKGSDKIEKNHPFFYHSYVAEYFDFDENIRVEFTIASPDAETTEKTAEKYRKLRNHIFNSVKVIFN